MNRAFTLAEVLITLGIIGVVAALTLPTLISNYQSKVYDTQAKKAKTITANGYKLMMARAEIFKIQNIPFLNNCNNLQDTDCVSKAHKEAFSIVKDSASGLNTSDLPTEYKITGKQLPSPFNWTDTKYIFATGDGMVFGVIPDEELTSFDITVDVNGIKNPNTALQDLRKFRFSGEGGNIFDVSEELTQVSECSFENPSGCETEEQCKSIQLPPDDDSGWWSAEWRTDNTCHVHYNT